MTKSNAGRSRGRSLSQAAVSGRPMLSRDRTAEEDARHLGGCADHSRAQSRGCSYPRLVVLNSELIDMRTRPGISLHRSALASQVTGWCTRAQTRASPRQARPDLADGGADMDLIKDGEKWLVQAKNPVGDGGHLRRHQADAAACSCLEETNAKLQPSVVTRPGKISARSTPADQARRAAIGYRNNVECRSALPSSRERLAFRTVRPAMARAPAAARSGRSRGCPVAERKAGRSPGTSRTSGSPSRA